MPLPTSRGRESSRSSTFNFEPVFPCSFIRRGQDAIHESLRSRYLRFFPTNGYGSRSLNSLAKCVTLAHEFQSHPKTARERITQGSRLPSCLNFYSIHLVDRKSPNPSRVNESPKSTRYSVHTLGFLSPLACPAAFWRVTRHQPLLF